mmetsp:Transcript_24572/g.40740  ORF Transcript_24572/g.40740 Transcript_24572/m.40740 type:complete len:304 (+) Transcript_24572:158-1069(+)
MNGWSFAPLLLGLRHAQTVNPLSIFCWAVVTPGTWEEQVLPYFVGTALLRCDDYALYTNCTSLAGGIRAVKFRDGTMQVPYNKTAMNTALFIEAYQFMVSEGRHQQHDWLVKLDVDTVLMVPRLRALLSGFDPEISQALAYGLFRGARPAGVSRAEILGGPVQPFSRAGFTALVDKQAWCLRHIEDTNKGEDYWIALCCQEAGVRFVATPHLLRDSVKDDDACRELAVAFHGYGLKDVRNYISCSLVAWNMTAHDNADDLLLHRPRQSRAHGSRSVGARLTLWERLRGRLRQELPWSWLRISR